MYHCYYVMGIFFWPSIFLLSNSSFYLFLRGCSHPPGHIISSSFYPIFFLHFNQLLFSFYWFIVPFIFLSFPWFGVCLFHLWSNLFLSCQHLWIGPSLIINSLAYFSSLTSSSHSPSSLNYLSISYYNLRAVSSFLFPILLFNYYYLLIVS